MTTLDFPGELAAVVFCQGCPWRCRYCHNGHLIDLSPEGLIPWKEIGSLLQRRRGLLDAVVFSGGEPTLQRALFAAVRETRDMGFKVGLHTAGCYPRRLSQLLPYLDWVGLDIKAMPEGYPAVTGTRGSGSASWKSLELLLESDIAFEVRTTVMPSWTLAGELAPLMNALASLGVTNYRLQMCRTQSALDPSIGLEGAPDLTSTALTRLGASLFSDFAIRADQ